MANTCTYICFFVMKIYQYWKLFARILNNSPTTFEIGIEFYTCLFFMEVWSDRGSTCKFRNARSAFRNLHVDPLSLHTSMRNKQVEFNPYIYTLSKLYHFGYEISVFYTKHPVIILRASLFVVTPSCRFMENWMSKFFLMFIVAENTWSVNIIK